MPTEADKRSIVVRVRPRPDAADGQRRVSVCYVPLAMMS